MSVPHVVAARHYALSLRSRRRRSVIVRVLVGGQEQDCFQVSGVETLRAAVRPILAHLPDGDASIQFTAVEERWASLGVSRFREQVSLSDLGAALSFLGD